MKKACVIGWPIAHSRSPLIHNYWLRKHGIDAVYERKPVEPIDVANFIADLPRSQFIGCNVTIPHKEAVFRAVGTADRIASRLAAVNTVYLRDETVFGTNTDGEGFIASLYQSYPSFVLRNKSAIIIGAGGAAKAIIGAFLDEGVRRIGIINRTADRVLGLQRQFGAQIYEVNDVSAENGLRACDVLVNATSQGMEGQSPLLLDIATLKPGALVADIVYTPLETAFLAKARRQGNPVLGGLGMLLHQAVRGFELWFGVKPEVTQELYDLVAADVQKVHEQ